MSNLRTNLSVVSVSLLFAACSPQSNQDSTATPAKLLSPPIVAESAPEVPPVYFHWDFGSTPGKLDRDDLLLDLSQGCNSTRLVINAPGVASTTALPEIPMQTADQTKKAISQFQLVLPDPRFFDLVNVIESHSVGGETLFVLMPEAHKSLTEAGRSAHTQIQYKRAYFVGGLIDGLTTPSIAILNLREGIEGGEWRNNDFKPKSSGRLGKIAEAAEAGSISAFLNIANVFSDAPNVVTSYLEKPDLVSAEALLFFGGFDGIKSFDESYAESERVLDTKLDRSHMEKAYRMLGQMSSAERDKFGHQVCKMRSEKMITRASAMAEGKKSKLVLMTYGASHHAEIADFLRKQNTSFLTIVGKLNAAK